MDDSRNRENRLWTHRTGLSTVDIVQTCAYGAHEGLGPTKTAYLFSQTQLPEAHRRLVMFLFSWLLHGILQALYGFMHTEIVALDGKTDE